MCLQLGACVYRWCGDWPDFDEVFPKAVHILTSSTTSRRVMNMTAIAAVDAQIRKQFEGGKRGG